MARFLHTITILALIPCVATLLTLFAYSSWICELFTHFRCYYVIVLLLCSIVLFAGRRMLPALVALIFLAPNLLMVMPLYFGPEFQETSATKIRGMLANVWSQNRQYDRFLKCVERENPDLLLVMEVDDDWMTASAQLKKDFPHHLCLPRSNNFGIAFFSKVPLQEKEAVLLRKVPAIVAKLAVDGQSLTVIGVHTVPPVNKYAAQIRNIHLNVLQKLVRQVEGPVVVMGDLNTTSWSPYFTELIDNTGLRDSRNGFGVQPTWIRFGGLIRLPIDHVLVSPRLKIHDRKVSSAIGSDHLPVVFDFSISRAN